MPAADCFLLMSGGLSSGVLSLPGTRGTRFPIPGRRFISATRTLISVAAAATATVAATVALDRCWVMY